MSISNMGSQRATFSNAYASQFMISSQNLSFINNQNKIDAVPLDQIRLNNDDKFFDPEYHRNRALGQYIGERKNGLRHGYGQMWFENGDFYAGYWEEDQPNGDGILFFSSQTSDSKFLQFPKLMYSGFFEKGKFNGVGKLINAFNSTQGQFIYLGQWKNGNREGFGKQYYETSECYYIGEWLNDMRHNKGKLIFYNSEYEGKWKENKMHGQGVLTQRENLLKTVTQGIWNDDLLSSGQIKYYKLAENAEMSKIDKYEQKGIYTGEIKQYLRDGQGDYFVKDYKGQTISFSGNFKSDQPLGTGTIKGQVQKNSYQISGNLLSKGDIGRAKADIHYWNKDRYHGQVDVENWIIKRERGRYHYSNGTVIEGVFKDNPEGKLDGDFRQIN